MRTPLPCWIVAPLAVSSCLLAPGCLKPQPVVTAVEPVSVAVATVLESVEQAWVVEAPDEVVERINDELTLRNLAPVAPGAEALSTFSSIRSTSGRLEQIAAATDAPALVLIEATPRFSAQVNGRYRWSVQTRISIAPSALTSLTSTESFTIPAHLIYSHQAEAEALAEVSPVVARDLGRMLDEWIHSEGLVAAEP